MAARLERLITIKGLLLLKQKNIRFDRHYERGLLWKISFESANHDLLILALNSWDKIRIILKHSSRAED